MILKIKTLFFRSPLFVVFMFVQTIAAWACGVYVFMDVNSWEQEHRADMQAIKAGDCEEYTFTVVGKHSRTRSNDYNVVVLRHEPNNLQKSYHVSRGELAKIPKGKEYQGWVCNDRIHIAKLESCSGREKWYALAIFFGAGILFPLTGLYLLDRFGTGN